MKFETGWTDSIARWGPRAKESGQPLEALKSKEMDFCLETPEGTHPSRTILDS